MTRVPNEYVVSYKSATKKTFKDGETPSIKEAFANIAGVTLIEVLPSGRVATYHVEDDAALERLKKRAAEKGCWCEQQQLGSCDI